MKKPIITAAMAMLLVLSMVLTGCVTPQTPTTTQPTTGPQPTVTVPTDPAPTDPAPTDPVPTDPAPTDPAPTDPAPTDPAPTDPAPTDPAPTDPAPTDPAPTDPAPTDPTEPDEIPVESITLSAPKTTVSVMEEVQITAAILPANADVLTVMYEPTGGQVLDNGVFFAAEPGVYVVTAYAMDDSGVSGSITIIVEAAPVTGIAISGGKTVTVGKTLQLSATVSPEIGRASCRERV